MKKRSTRKAIEVVGMLCLMASSTHNSVSVAFGAASLAARAFEVYDGVGWQLKSEPDEETGLNGVERIEAVALDLKSVARENEKC